MKFGEINLAGAIGAILAHSVKAGKSKFKKGRVLSASDVETLQSAGVETVFAARLQPGDLVEDAAARAVADAAAGDGVRISEPFTGRANLYAEQAGLVVVDEARLHEINHLNEGLTIATMRSHERVSPRQMMATVKVIPFALPQKVVDAACNACGSPVLSIAPFTAHSVGLVMTRLLGMKESLLKKTRAVMEQRLHDCGSEIGLSTTCGHEVGEISRAIKAQNQLGLSPILVFGASAIVDRGDVVPAGLEAAGGEVLHLGMPVDPGNLLMLGTLGETPVIGVPSCARSPKLNGFDWVLERILAGLPVSPENLMDMGAGGLLKEIPSRPRPRERTTRQSGSASKIAALVLAAGRSTRMGVENKLLKTVAGKAMLRLAVETAIASAAEKVTVVTGHQSDDVQAALSGLDVNFVHNPDFKQGLSTSLKAGIGVLAEDCDGAIVILGDMPLVTAPVLDTLIAAFDPVEGRSICVPTFDGKRGNPILWSAQYFPDFLALSGDIGAKHLMSENEDGVCEVAMPDSGVLLDFDTPEAFKTLNQP